MSHELKIVLASTSPRRVDLLKQVGLDFDVVSPMCDEPSIHPNPRKRVMENAYAKAKSVNDKSQSSLVIGADTLVYVDDEALGKPEGRGEAAVMLVKLSGKVHKVFTGVAVIDTSTGKESVSVEKTLVHIKPLTESEIFHYVETGEPIGKAGAYAIQGIGGVLVGRIIGCISNVIGLPLPLLSEMLGDFGYDILENVSSSD
ncbi:MAG: Maf family protein [Candidatus Bathyarchaeota archaeon]|nr:Maf family protein [Candidatus Bathyarchaeota archaeon]